MNKRQKKKREKKRVPVVADEANFLTMTNEELEEAHKGYDEFVRKYAYRKKYKNLKGKHLTYFYPVGKNSSEWLAKIMNTGRRDRKSMVVTQSLNDITKVQGHMSYVQEQRLKHGLTGNEKIIIVDPEGEYKELAQLNSNCEIVNSIQEIENINPLEID